MKANAKEAESYLLGADRLITPAGSPEDIRDLLSKIERKLPDVAHAGHDLRALRDLLNSQLLNATALQATKYPPSYLSAETGVGTQA